jgi:hypothetical protein
MKTAFLSAALLFALSAQLPALNVVRPVHPVHHAYELNPQVIETRRVGAAVVAPAASAPAQMAPKAE